MFSGPVRTGKTRAILEKCNWLALKYKKSRFLWLRQTKESMAQTVLQTYEEHVMVPSLMVNPECSRNYRQSYIYENGSEIVVGGLSDPEAYMSGEYDMICVFQAEECLENSVRILMTRLSNGVLPFQQMILDVNPRSSNHWIKRMCDNEGVPMLMGTLKDNPKYWNHEKNTWTMVGGNFVKTLERLRGHEYDRKVLGKWANPEGARFKDASRAVQGFSFKEKFPYGIPEHWPKWISIDYGKADPYCALWHTSDEQGRIWTYREDYSAGFEADEQAERVKHFSPENEHYEGIWFDASMFQSNEYARGFGMKNGKSAVQQYEDVLDSPRFGSMNAGEKRVEANLFVRMDAMLRSGDWMISLDCINLWNELEGAVHYKNPKTGIFSELVNPPGIKPKPCPDHALAAAGYGTCRNISLAPLRLNRQEEIERDRFDRQATRVAALMDKLERFGQRGRRR